MKPEICIVVGTRPEVIKCAPVLAALSERQIPARLIATGQHAELLDTALDAFSLTPDARQPKISPDGGLAGMTGQMLAWLGSEIAAHRPRAILVQGDTSTTLAGALAAFYARVPCMHIEAGLRSGRMDAPWPEEMNRVVVTRLAARHYAPTTQARDNLLREGVAEADVVVTGQTGVDAALSVAVGGRPQGLPAPGDAFIYVTAHRRENQSGGISRVLRGIADALDGNPGVSALLAAHPSPEVRREVAMVEHPRLHVTGPVSYANSVWLIANAALVVTDSGGIQEEAPAFGTPVLVTREVTERPEGVTDGFIRLAGTEPAAVRDAINETLADTGLRARLKARPNPYGDGRAAQRIADDVATWLKS